MPGLINPWVWIGKLPETLPPLLEDLPALEAYLRSEMDGNPDIMGLAVMTSDGDLIAASRMPEDIRPMYREFSAEVALSEAMCAITGRGVFEEMYLKFEQIYVALMPVIGDHILVILVRRDFKI